MAHPILVRGPFVMAVVHNPTPKPLSCGACRGKLPLRANFYLKDGAPWCDACVATELRRLDRAGRITHTQEDIK